MKIHSRDGLKSEMDFLKEKPQVLFEYFLQDYGSLFDIDAEECRTLRKTDKIFQELSTKWYDDLEHEHERNIYEVYNHDYYFIDIFNCFVTYSRDYIKRIIKSSHFQELKDAKVIVDIGCGISYSTCLLKQIFPEAKVYAINLKGTKQWKLCEIMAQRFDFNLVESIHDIEESVDILWASEYFEHIYNPIEHVDDIIKTLNPKHMIVANSFNTWGMGHFTKYDVYGTIVSQDKVSKMFNQHLMAKQYENVKCGIWNNKPIVWKRNDQSNTSSLYRF